MATPAQKPAPKEERPNYNLRFNDMNVRYIRDARSGDAGYHPGQPKQVIVEVEVEKDHTPYEIRVPASQLKPIEETTVQGKRAWPPPAPEREAPPPLKTGRAELDDDDDKDKKLNEKVKK
jgi:hypothetical protein